MNSVWFFAYFKRTYLSNITSICQKKSSCNEVFTHTKKFFDLILQDKSFLGQNNRNNFILKDGTTVKYVNLDTSMKKLRIKYANLKTEWCFIKNI